MSPFFISFECEKCSQVEFFYPDKIDNRARYVSFDRRHDVRLDVAPSLSQFLAGATGS